MTPTELRIARTLTRRLAEYESDRVSVEIAADLQPGEDVDVARRTLQELVDRAVRDADPSRQTAAGGPQPAAGDARAPTAGAATAPAPDAPRTNLGGPLEAKLRDLGFLPTRKDNVWSKITDGDVRLYDLTEGRAYGKRDGTKTWHPPDVVDAWPETRAIRAFLTTLDPNQTRPPQAPAALAPQPDPDRRVRVRVTGAFGDARQRELAELGLTQVGRGAYEGILPEPRVERLRKVRGLNLTTLPEPNDNEDNRPPANAPAPGGGSSKAP